ncbi:MAG: zinc-dependent metalloprotease family protein [Phycisphaerales bacterium JB054]
MRKAIALAMLLGLTPALASAQIDNQTMRERVASSLELSDFSIQRLDVPEGNVEFATDIFIGGLEYQVVVTPHSFRSPSATAMIGVGGGEIRQTELPAPLTVRAEFEGAPDINAAGSRMGGGLHLTISLPGADGHHIWTVQPLYDAIPGSDPSLHVVHRADDMDMDEQHTCGVADHDHGQVEQGELDGGSGHSRAFLVCELACEADWEYYGRNGNSEDDTIADMDNIVARCAAIYEGQCNVTFQIPYYLIWTTSSDPYTSTNPSTRLGQIRNWWTANQGSVHRDLVHTFTGINVDGNVIGIAYLSAVCGSNGYGMVQSRYTGGINARTALSAHEMGHNFSAGHCDGSGDCHIMCSGLGGCNGLGNPAFFGTASANKIGNYAANRPCLDEAGIPYPFLEQWDSTTIDTFVWTDNSGGEVNTGADNEPSDPYSLNLDSADSITTGDIDLSGLNQPTYVSFYAQHKGVEQGETLVVEYLDILQQWTELAVLTSDGNDQTDFTFVNAEVGLFGWWEGFRLRFRTTGSDGTDDWYVDDIAIAPFAGNAIPFHEPFADADFNTSTNWAEINGATVSTDATNEPSDPYSMNLDGTDSATSFNFLLNFDQFPVYLSFFAQHKGVENGKQLVVEYLNDAGSWLEFTTLTSDGNDQNSFEFHQNSLIFDAYHEAMAFRFRALGADGTDDWYIDDIRLGDEFTPPDDCVADFNGDDTVNTQDVLAFLNAWNNGDPSADINGDGNVNTQDVLAFLNLWNAGC